MTHISPSSALFALAMIALPATAWAQDAGTPTRAGTEITATATATFTDANDNEYEASDSFTLTVAYMPGVDVSVDGDVVWEAPSQEKELTYTLSNVSNDSTTFSFNVVSSGGTTFRGYRIGEAPAQDGTLDDLNDELAGIMVDYEGNADGHDHALEVTLIYDVDADLTEDETLEVEVISKHPDSDATGTDGATTTIEVSPLYGGLAVTASDGTQSELPNREYTAQFTISVDDANSGGTIELDANFDAEASDFSVTEIAVESGASEAQSTIEAEVLSGESITVTVTYSIASEVTAGTEGKLTLTATHQEDSAVTAMATTEITVLSPSVSIEKQAVVAVNGAQLSGDVEPDEEFWYAITIRNNESGSAAPVMIVEVTDSLPDAVEYLGYSIEELGTDYAGTVEYHDNEHVVTAELTAVDGQAALPVGASWTFWIKVRVR